MIAERDLTGTAPARRERNRGWMRVVAWLVVLSAGAFSACSDLVTEPQAGPDAPRFTESTCGNGFSQAQCDAIQEALYYLQSHVSPECAAMGFWAQDRFDNGDFHYDASTTDYGYMYTGGSETYLGGSAFNAGELANTIAHEESHHEGYEDLSNGGANDAYRVGDGCAGYI